MSAETKTDMELLARLIVAIDDSSLAEHFIADFLSQSEITDIAERWRILEKIDQGLSQRQVRDELNVSLAKVSRCAQILKSDRQSYLKLKHKMNFPHKQA